MAFVIDDRIKETSTTTGTGTYTLAGAVTGYQSFAAIGNANTTWYGVSNGIDWEFGIGTYTAAGTTLARTTVFSSSNADAAVNWGAGTKTIVCTLPASKNVLLDGANTFTSTSGQTIAGPLTISGASAGQIVFPASQNASADANTLDDYEEGTWTPGVTFVTPGNLNVVYSTQSGTYVKIGKRVFFLAQIITSTFTHTTASGNFVITGLPFTAASGVYFAACAMGGYTKVNFTHVMTQITSAATTQNVIAGGSAQGLVYLAVADVPTGGTVNITLEGQYEI